MFGGGGTLPLRITLFVPSRGVAMPTKGSNKVSQYIIDGVTAKLNALGVADFYYAIVPTDQSGLVKKMGRSAKFYFGNLSSQKKMRFAVVSDTKILKFREEFLNRFTKLDCRFLYSIPPSYDEGNPVYHPPFKLFSDRHQKAIEYIWSKYEIGCAATTYHSIEGNSDWIGIFHLFFREHQQDTKQLLEPIEQELFSLLQEYSEIFVAHAHQDINPIANFGLLSSNCVKILEMAADGDSSEEIGKKLFLSERGVNYHLDRAREILDARNRTNLVSKAYKKGLL